MTKKVNITVWNKLIKEKKYVNVYHHSNRRAYIISYNNSLTRDIKPIEEDDYLHISVVSGPGSFSTDCVLNLPSFMDFKFWASGEVALFHSGKRTLLKIPPGPPTWELKMTMPKLSPTFAPMNGDHITISSDDEWPD
jgi:hypothetical protein